MSNDDKPGSTDKAEFTADARGMYQNKFVKGNAISTPLCNFDARIIEDIEVDDGSGAVKRRLVINGSRSRIEVPIEQFDSMAWVTNKYGPTAIIGAGDNVRRLLAVAIKTLSPDVIKRTVYTHLGWRQIDGSWRYLHGGGAIPADDGIDVALDPPLSDFRLIPPVDLCAAVQASLLVLDVAPARISYPLMCATYRAPLGEFAPITLSVFCTGASGVLKTAMARLAQSHFGTAWGSRDPANWASTANANERIAFLGKDALLLIDDYVPSGARHDRDRLQGFADRIFRGQANRAGRIRMTADIALRPENSPRGMIIATGEDVPGGHSLRARLVVVEFKAGDVDKERLTVAQLDAANGLYAQAMAGYVAWLATQKKAQFARRLENLRVMARRHAYGHDRTPENVAALMLGLDCFLDFAMAAGAIDKTDADSYATDGWEALSAGGRAQSEQLRSEKPAERFQALLRAVLKSGHAHLVNVRGGEPEVPSVGGWRRTNKVNGDHTIPVWEPRGDQIGWIGGDDLYLNGDATFAAVQKMARAQGAEIALLQQSLWSRLKEAKLLVRTDPQRNTIRKTLGGTQETVLHMNAPRVLGALPGPGREDDD